MRFSWVHKLPVIRVRVSIRWTVEALLWDGRHTGRIGGAICTGPFGLRFGGFSGPSLVCLGFLQLHDSFLQWVDRVLFLKFVVLNAFDYNF